MPRNRLFALLGLLTVLALLVTSGLAVAQDTRLPPQRSLAPEHATPESALRSSVVTYRNNACAAARRPSANTRRRSARFASSRKHSWTAYSVLTRLTAASTSGMM